VISTLSNSHCSASLRCTWEHIASAFFGSAIASLIARDSTAANSARSTDPGNMRVGSTSRQSKFPSFLFPNILPLYYADSCCIMDRNSSHPIIIVIVIVGHILCLLGSKIP